MVISAKTGISSASRRAQNHSRRCGRMARQRLKNPLFPSAMRASLATTLLAIVSAGIAQAAPPSAAPLPVMKENPFYTVTPYALPDHIKLEASGLAVLPDGKLAVSTRKGEIWLLEHPEADPKNPKAVGYKLFAAGLH